MKKINSIFFYQKTPARPLRLLPLLLLCLILLLTGCSAASAPLSKTGLYFDTVITVTIYDKEKEPCLENCFALAEKYETMLSPTIEGSDIWNINHSDGKSVVVSDETAYLLETALSYCELTDGRIDLTIEPVSELWDFHEFLSSNATLSQEPQSCIPDNNSLAEAVSHVDYHNLLIDGNTVTLTDRNASVSLGFIAKGYIADKMKEYLVSQNIKSAIINLGGNLLAVGSKPDGTSFQFGIQKPFEEQGTPVTTVSVCDKSLVSSGVYERYFYEDDVLYHHILNPKTGYPVRNELLSVTILSDSSMTGDALSTTCFVLGLEEGMALIEDLDNVEAIFITNDGTLHNSTGLKP